MTRPGAVVCVALCVSGCGSGPRPTTISQVAKAYLEELVVIMEAHSINRKVIDWAAFRERVFAEAGVAQTIPDTYDAIYVALGLLGDGHSFFITPSGGWITHFSNSHDCSQPAPTT